MHGVPQDLPLGSFVGNCVTQLCIGENEVILNFSGDGFIRFESTWEMFDISGRLVDRSMEHTAREAYRLHTLLGVPIVAFSINAPESFSLIFGSGHILQIFDDSHSFESFSVVPAGSEGVTA